MIRSRLGLSAAPLAALLLFARQPAVAQSPTAERELRVGVFEAPPYAMKDASGRWRGLTVDLWKQLALDLGLRYRFEEASEDAVLEALSGGRLDLAAAPLAATMERQQIMDFSNTYLTTGIALAVRQRSRMERLLDLFRVLATSEAAHIILAIACLSLVFGTALWLAERRRNPQFPVAPGAGIGSGLWWAGVTTTFVGYGDKVPVTVRGRALALLWMIVSVVLTVVLTAGVTASLAVAQIETSRGTEVLRHARVGALEGSTSADFLRRNRVSRRLYSRFDRALDALARRDVDAVMFSEEILRYYAERDTRSALDVLPEIFMSESLAFPVPDGSPLRDSINRALRRALAGPHWRELRDQYLVSETFGERR